MVPGGGTRDLFRRDDERIMRLAAAGDLPRNARAGCAEALDGVLHPSVVDVRTAVQGEDLGIGQPLRRVAEDRHLVLAMRDDPPVEEGHGLTLPNALAVDGRVAHRTGAPD